MHPYTAELIAAINRAEHERAAELSRLRRAAREQAKAERPPKQSPRPVPAHRPVTA